MTQHDPAPTVTYLLDRDELLRIRNLKLLTSGRDYVFFALQIDYPGKLTPAIDVVAFCDRWELDEGDLYKALGELRKKGIVVSISSQLNLQLS
ncbi:hypothetical protein [Leptolyngbya sp. GGD]|uniref:hypothetical protein n=1 Tax=Leptolyngbya sp. GGD TaxID=2997907 RepID=UPI00227B587A|nr:hypothetical protein [Leptolyngbya sp. GGD]MCY6494593.1 hypothetical protein [Leptolyngbya sp. GGD]